MKDLISSIQMNVTVAVAVNHSEFKPKILDFNCR